MLLISGPSVFFLFTVPRLSTLHVCGDFFQPLSCKNYCLFFLKHHPCSLSDLNHMLFSKRSWRLAGRAAVQLRTILRNSQKTVRWFPHLISFDLSKRFIFVIKEKRREKLSRCEAVLAQYSESLYHLWQSQLSIMPTSRGNPTTGKKTLRAAEHRAHFNILFLKSSNGWVEMAQRCHLVSKQSCRQVLQNLVFQKSFWLF